MDNIYEIRQSNKGWSESYCFTFNEETARRIITELKDTGHPNNFRIIKHECYYPKDVHFTLHTEWNWDGEYDF